MDRQVELLERFFRQDEMKAALTRLEETVGLPKHRDRRAGAMKTATRAQAENVVAALKMLGDAANLPRLTIQIDNLHRVAPLIGAVSLGDERGVAARLEAMEILNKKNMEEMLRMVQSVARSVVQATALQDTANNPEVVGWNLPPSPQW